MKLPENKRIKWNYLAIAFAIPVISLLVLMIIGRYEPFGDRSMLYSDMYHQYYPFFVSFRRALLSGESLLWNWDVGMGLDYLGLISYYLASPLNLLSILVPEGWTLEYFSLLVPIKLGLASLFFAIFLKKIFEKNDLSISLFGAFYGMCAWALAYQWNVMWLDTFALLPLVALGTVALLRDRKFVLYTLTLFLSIFSNYYIGFFTCIFVLLLFFCYEICRFRSIRKLLADFCVIGFFTVLAIGMTAILELPSLAALQTTQSSVNKFPEGFSINMTTDDTWKGFFDVMRQVAGNMGGGLEPSFKEGLPNLYCGVGTMVLAVLFLLSGKVKLRDKICSVVLLLFITVSFIFRQLDYIWHGFHFTNMIPYRFSFLYSFILLYMAYKAFLMRNEFKMWQTVLAVIPAVLAFGYAETREDPVYLAYNLIFLALYVIVFLVGQYVAPVPKENSQTKAKKNIHRVNTADLADRAEAELHNRRSLAGWFLCGIMALELILNVVNFGVNFPCTAVSNYPKGTSSTETVIDIMEELENNDVSFYRTESTHSQTLNDGAINGYYGISTFTSSANVRVTEFMQALGYGAKNTYNRYCFEESSPVANLFLNLKYMLERDGKVEQNPFFEDLYHAGNVHLLKNNAYLPLGFLAESALAELEFTLTGNRFNFQNQLLTAASGITGNVWHQLGNEDLTVTPKDVTMSSGAVNGYCSYSSKNSSGSMIYRYTADQSGLMCIHLELSKKNSYTVTLKKAEDIALAGSAASARGLDLYSETYSLPQMLSVCYVEPGDVIELRFTCKANENGTIKALAALVDEDVFTSAYEKLSSSTLKLDSFSTTLIEGTIACDRDGLLYTSIPQNGNWTAEIDGETAEIRLVGNAMIAVPITQGEHTVVFRYENQAFSLGWKVSLACAAVFVGVCFLVYRPKKKRGKYEKTDNTPTSQC